MCDQGLTPMPCLRLHIIRRIDRGTIRDKDGQGSGCCPVHDDQHASLRIRLGDHHRIVWQCRADCDPYAIRVALTETARISASCLGNYCGGDYTGRHRSNPADTHLIRELRARVAERDKTITEIGNMLRADLTPAMRSLRIEALIEGVKVPEQRAEFLALAERAGISRPVRYRAWAQNCEEAT